MWRKCVTVFDEPIIFLFWEWDEMVLFLGIFFVGQFLLGPFWSMGLALGAASSTYWLKRGQPPGAVVHWLHSSEVLTLPGLLSPTPTRYER
jgi:hypothetical protein